jgi:hypothetical protein
VAARCAAQQHLPLLPQSQAFKTLQTALQGWCAEVKEDMKKAFSKIVEDIQVHVKHLAFSERAMLLLFAAQHPCLEEHAFAHAVLPKLCHSILSAVTTSQQLLVRWWSTYPKDILARRVIAPLQSYITVELQARLAAKPPVVAILACTLSIRLYQSPVSAIAKCFGNGSSPMLGVIAALTIEPAPSQRSAS